MHYILTNASRRYLDHMQSILASVGQDFTVFDGPDGYTILQPSHGTSYGAILEWDRINSLSSFDFVSFEAEDTKMLPAAKHVIREHALTPIAEEEIFKPVRNARPGENVGNKRGYASQHSETAAYTAKPVKPGNDVIILDTSESYNTIFARKFDDDHYHTVGTTSYADRYDRAPPMTMKLLQTAIDDIIASKADDDRTVCVFDFGAGHGRIALPVADYIRSRGFRPKIIAYDTSKFALDTFESRLQNTGHPFHRGSCAPDDTEFILLNSLNDIGRNNGRADLSISIAGSLHHAPDEATLRAFLEMIRNLLSEKGLLIGTGPTANIRYRERILSHLDIRISTQMFEDVFATVHSLMDAQFAQSLHPDFRQKLDNLTEHGELQEVLDKYDLSAVEMAVLMAELIMQERPLGHPNFMGSSPYTPQWEAAENVSPTLYPEYADKKLYTKWIYRMELADTLSQLLSESGFVPEYYGPDTLNHNDIAAKDPWTVQQEIRLSKSTEVDPSQAFDYVFRAHKRDLFLDRPISLDIHHDSLGEQTTNIDALKFLISTLEEREYRNVPFIRDLAIALDPQYLSGSNGAAKNTRWDWHSILKSGQTPMALGAYRQIRLSPEYRRNLLEGAEKLFEDAKTAFPDTPQMQSLIDNLAKHTARYYNKTISRTIGKDGTGGFITAFHTVSRNA